MSKLVHIPFQPLKASDRTTATISRWGDKSLLSNLGCQVLIGEPSAPSMRQAHIVFAGDSDDATGSFAIFQKVANRANNSFTFESLGSGTFTVGSTDDATVIGADAGLTADTISFTPSNYYNTLLSVLGSPSWEVHSPADNTTAYLFLPELGSMDIYIDTWRGTAASVQAVVRTLL